MSTALCEKTLDLVTELSRLKNEEVNKILSQWELPYPCHRCTDSFSYCDCERPKIYKEIKKIISELSEPEDMDEDKILETIFDL